MQLRQALRLAGAGALTGALLLGPAPLVYADDIRDRQWALDAFAAEDIWQHSTGDGVVVAVIDTGVDASHPDLKGQVLEGKDFTGTGSAHDDTVGHGTGLAGLIAGQGHGPGGESGVKGLAPGAKILPVKFTNKKQEYGAGSSWAAGVEYAVDEGADVINISHVSGRDTKEQRAIEYALEHDVVVVAGTGNLGSKIENFPAAYPGVVAVGGINNEGAVWKDSSWGSNTTLMAPATNNVVPNSTYESGYALANGTSDSAAYVSAAAALVIAEHPDLTAGQVINRLVKTAKIPAGESKTAQLPDNKFGYGIIRPFRAVTYDIPAGPKEGPLAQPSEEETSTSSGSDDSQAAPDNDASAEGDEGGISPVMVGLIVVVGLGILGLVIGLVVKSQRTKQSPYGGGPGSPDAPASQWPGVPPQHPGQQHYPPQAGQFNGPPASPPPPPNQPPQQ